MVWRPVHPQQGPQPEVCHQDRECQAKGPVGRGAQVAGDASQAGPSTEVALRGAAEAGHLDCQPEPHAEVQDHLDLLGDEDARRTHSPMVEDDHGEDCDVEEGCRRCGVLEAQFPASGEDDDGDDGREGDEDEGTVDGVGAVGARREAEDENVAYRLDVGGDADLNVVRLLGEKD